MVSRVIVHIDTELLSLRRFYHRNTRKFIHHININQFLICETNTPKMFIIHLVFIYVIVKVSLNIFNLLELIAQIEFSRINMDILSDEIDDEVRCIARSSVAICKTHHHRIISIYVYLRLSLYCMSILNLKSIRRSVGLLSRSLSGKADTALIIILLLLYIILVTFASSHRPNSRPRMSFGHFYESERNS